MGTKADYSRASFIPAVAPHDQKCSCQCGGNIARGSGCFIRPFVEHGRVTGHTRIISMEHYDDWLENVAHVYADRIAQKNPAFRSYIEI